MLHTKHIHWLPESGATILVGFLFGGVSHFLQPAEEGNERLLYFNPVFHNLFLLPPIIFESG
jgi:hypothetical protein